MGLRMSLIQATKVRKFVTSNQIDHGEKDHVIREIEHSIKRCFGFSIPESLKGQRIKSNSNLILRLSPAGGGRGGDGIPSKLP
jgi:Tfp pilus assembly ATPase PilU